MRINNPYSLLILTCIINNLGYSMLCINRVTLTNPSSTLTLTFNSAFSSMPQYAFAIQNLSFQQTGVTIQNQIVTPTLTSFIIRFNITTTSGTLNTNDQTTLIAIFSNYPTIQMNSVTVNGLTSIINFQNSHMYRSDVSYNLNIYTQTIPAKWQIQSKSSTNFRIAFLLNPGITIIFSYILVQKVFISSQIFVLFDQITQVRRNFIILVDSQNFIQASDSSTFVGLMQATYTSPHLRLKKFAAYSYFDPASGRPAIQVGYMSTGSAITYLISSYVIFNPNFRHCPDSNYLSYSTPFTTIPQSCLPCHPTCQTCTSSEQDSRFSDKNYCLTCRAGRYLSVSNNDVYGVCKCLKGLTQDASGNCIQCQFNCLIFTVSFIKSQTAAVFLLVFTYSDLTYEMPFDQNFQVSINKIKVDYTYSQTKPGIYQIALQNADMKPCQTTCAVKFHFLFPDKIKHTNKYLTKQQQTIQLQDYYLIQDRLPDELNRAFSITGLLISASSATGQTALIKMLFQLQQIIQVHKYLNMQIPVVFKEFIQALSSFRFLDVTAVIDYDINQNIRDLSTNKMDLRGSPKIIYYEHGVNFYKNIVPVIVSVIIMIIINLILYFLLWILPFQTTQSLALKIRIRWMISLSDLVQSLVIPIVLFATFQMSYFIYTLQTSWIYLLTCMFSVCVLMFPFYMLIYTNNLKRNASAIVIEIVQDLFLDCKLHSKITQVFYVYNFMKKVIFGLFLASNLSGIVQLFILMIANLIHLLFIIYIVAHKLYNSKLKILTRSINLVCIIALQGIIFGYNMNYYDIDHLILMGVTCTYLTLVVTGIGIIEIFIKVAQVIFQRVMLKQKQQIHHQSESSKHNIKNQQNQQLKQKNKVKVMIFQSQTNSIQQNKMNSEQEYREEVIKNVKNTIKPRLINQKDIKLSKKKQEEMRQNYSDIVSIESNDILRQDNARQYMKKADLYRRSVQRAKNIRQSVKKNNFQQKQKFIQRSKPKIFEFQQKQYYPVNKNSQRINQTKKSNQSNQSNDRKTTATVEQPSKQAIESSRRDRRKLKKPIGKTNEDKNNLIVNPSKIRNKNKHQIQSSISQIVHIQQQH